MSKSANDDTTPDTESYAYAWSKDSDVSLEDFLKKKPSMIQDDGTKPWIWVKSSEASKEDGDSEKAIEEATEYLKEITKRIEEIKNDASIPTRSNKKTGAKSKKEVREQVQAEAAEKLKEISQTHNYVSGKWLIFAQADKVDMIWSKLAQSLVSGPLSSTCAYSAKVATSPKSDTPNYQHVMCLYMPDVYDKDAVTEVMKVLLRNHGMNLTGVKSNLYTSISLDSKHASGIQSTVWKNTALLKDTEIKELKEEFYSGIGSKAEKPASEKAKDDGEKKEAAGTSKLKLQKKPVTDDPFGSDDDQENASEEKPKPKKAALKNKTAPDSDSEDEKPKTKAKKVLPPKKKAAPDSDSEDEKPKSKAKKAVPSKKKAVASDIDSDEEPKPKGKKPMPVKKVTKKRAKSDDDSNDSEAEKPRKKKVSGR